MDSPPVPLPRCQNGGKERRNVEEAQRGGEIPNRARIHACGTNREVAALAHEAGDDTVEGGALYAHECKTPAVTERTH